MFNVRSNQLAAFNYVENSIRNSQQSGLCFVGFAWKYATLKGQRKLKQQNIDCIENGELITQKAAKTMQLNAANFMMVPFV